MRTKFEPGKRVIDSLESALVSVSFGGNLRCYLGIVGKCTSEGGKEVHALMKKSALGNPDSRTAAPTAASLR